MQREAEADAATRLAAEQAVQAKTDLVRTLDEQLQRREAAAALVRQSMRAERQLATEVARKYAADENAARRLANERKVMAGLAARAELAAKAAAKGPGPSSDLMSDVERRMNLDRLRKAQARLQISDAVVADVLVGDVLPPGPMSQTNSETLATRLTRVKSSSELKRSNSSTAVVSPWHKTAHAKLTASQPSVCGAAKSPNLAHSHSFHSATASTPNLIAPITWLTPFHFKQPH